MRDRPVHHLLVTAQLAGVAVAALPLAGHDGARAWLAASVVGAVLGLVTLYHNRPGNFRVLPAPHVRGTLVTTGPYRAVRHPMYTALLLVVAGLAGWHGQSINAAGVALAAAAVAMKAREEERLLARRFAGYAAYRERTRRFVPFVY